jgi:hypothetical protein
MNKRISSSILFLVMGLLISSTLSAQSLNEAPQLDPYLPGELNERALYALKENDVPTAVILLERAYRLNPHSPDIKANLELVRKIDQANAPTQINGEVVYLDALGNTVSSEKIVDVPALWPESKLNAQAKSNLKP